MSSKKLIIVNSMQKLGKYFINHKKLFLIYSDLKVIFSLKNFSDYLYLQ